MLVPTMFIGNSPALLFITLLEKFPELVRFSSLGLPNTLNRLIMVMINNPKAMTHHFRIIRLTNKRSIIRETHSMCFLVPLVVSLLILAHLFFLQLEPS